MEESRITVACLVSALLVASVALSAVTTSGDVYLYLYGATWCPHCRSLDLFLAQTYPGRYYFCKIDLYEVCRNVLDSIRSFFASKGVSSEYLGYIPQTYVIKDGRYLIAVVVGAVTDIKFWQNITARSPQEKVVLIVSPEVYEIQVSFREQQELVELITKHTVTTTAPPSSQQGVEPRLVIPIALIATGALVIAYSILRRRKL
ncbi:MAG: thioredoxin family protein [Sulfolobales archaeon]